MTNGLTIDLEEMVRINSRLKERKEELQSTSKEAQTTLESLKTVIQCDGIAQTLGSLESGITQNAQKADGLFEKIASFIDSQIAQYREINEQTARDTQGVSSSLESMIK